MSQASKDYFAGLYKSSAAETSFQDDAHRCMDGVESQYARERKYSYQDSPGNPAEICRAVWEHRADVEMSPATPREVVDKKPAGGDYPVDSILPVYRDLTNPKLGVGEGTGYFGQLSSNEVGTALAALSAIKGASTNTTYAKDIDMRFVPFGGQSNVLFTSPGRSVFAAADYAVLMYKLTGRIPDTSLELSPDDLTRALGNCINDRKNSSSHPDEYCNWVGMAIAANYLKTKGIAP